MPVHTYFLQVYMLKCYGSLSKRGNSLYKDISIIFYFSPNNILERFHTINVETIPSKCIIYSNEILLMAINSVSSIYPQTML